MLLYILHAFSSVGFYAIRKCSFFRQTGAIMSLFSGRSIVDAVRALPDIFMLQPSSNYQALTSHSTQELAEKTQALTVNQMQKAFKYADRRIKNEKKPTRAR